jgi:hypothetical protein
VAVAQRAKQLHVFISKFDCGSLGRIPTMAAASVFDFKSIQEALQEKYGALPERWEDSEYLEDQISEDIEVGDRSGTMSMFKVAKRCSQLDYSYIVQETKMNLQTRDKNGNLRRLSFLDNSYRFLVQRFSISLEKEVEFSRRSSSGTASQLVIDADDRWSLICNVFARAMTGENRVRMEVFSLIERHVGMTIYENQIEFELIKCLAEKAVEWLESNGFDCSAAKAVRDELQVESTPVEAGSSVLVAKGNDNRQVEGPAAVPASVASNPVCAQCGQQNNKEDAFCAMCGTFLSLGDNLSGISAETGGDLQPPGAAGNSPPCLLSKKRLSLLEEKLRSGKITVQEYSTLLDKDKVAHARNQSRSRGNSATSTGSSDWVSSSAVDGDWLWDLRLPS